MPPISEPFGAIAKGAVEGIANGLDKLFTSDDERLSHAEMMERIKQNPAMWQAQTNQQEAKHASVFVAGWRPFIGWVCGIGLACYFIPRYVLGSFLWAQTCLQAHHLVAYPVDAAELLALVTTMLGSQIIRTIDKKNGTASS